VVDVLAIAAHRDDVELTCGGTLIKMADMGYKTGVLDLTEGEMGTRGTRKQREKEAEEAARIMGLRVRESLRLPDAGVEYSRETSYKMAAVIRRLRPHTVILPYWEGRHPDHFHTSQIGWDACFFAGLKKLPIEGEPHRPFKVIYSASYITAQPNFIVDITAQAERRWEAVQCYKSQFFEFEEGDKTFPEPEAFKDRVHIRLRYWGGLIGVKYGEPFVQKEMFAIEDIVKLGGRSM